MFRATTFKRRRGRAGFTIIEALVALAIVVMSLAAIGSVIATTARGIRSIEQHVALVETARAVEAGMPDRDQLDVGEMSGELAGNRWSVDVSPYLGGGIEAGRSSLWTPQAVVITVRSPSGAVLRISSLRLRRSADR